MYDFQITKKSERVIFKGQKEDVLSYLNEQYQIAY